MVTQPSSSEFLEFLLTLRFQRGLATQSLRDQRRAMRLHLDQVLHLVRFDLKKNAKIILTKSQPFETLVQGSRGPDDRILASCLLLANEASAVTLLTDDINLANKVEENFETNQVNWMIKSFLMQARANGLRVATSSNVRTELGGGLDSHSRPVKEGFSQGGKCQQGGEAAQVQDRARENFQKESEVARGAVRQLLEVVLLEEFKEAYGDPLWRQVVADSITLSLFLKCYLN